MADKIVISGLGVLAPNGLGAKSFLDAIRAGKSGLRRIERIDISKQQCKVAGCLDEEILKMLFENDPELGGMDRSAALAMTASLMAREEAWLNMPEAEGLKQGVIIGSAIGPIQALEEAYASISNQSAYIKPSSVPKTMLHTAASAIAARHALSGPSATVAAGDASSLVALDLAMQTLRSGAANIMLVGGVDCPIVDNNYRMWDALRVLTRSHNHEPEKASRPFSADRSGMTLSEGCGFVVLEFENTALERNAHIYAELLGVAQTTSHDSMHQKIVDAQAACMEEALTRANLKKSKLDHIQANAMSSPSADAAEAEAIAQVFGKSVDQIAVSSIKSMIGHALGASGILSLIAVLLGMREGFIPPTINLENPDPSFSLNHVANAAREATIETAMINAFDPKGSNASAIVRNAKI